MKENIYNIKTIDLDKKICVDLLSYSHSNEYLACVSEDEGVLIISNILYDYEIKLFSYSGYITSLAISNDSKYVVCGDEEGAIIIWNIYTGEKLITLEANKDAVNYLIFDRQGCLASTSFDDLVNIWEIPNGKLIKTLRPVQKVMSSLGDDDILEEMSYSSDYKYLATVGRYSKRVWDIENNKEIAFVFGKNEHSCSVAFNPDRKEIAFGIHRSIVFYTPDLNHIIKTVYEESNTFIRNLKYSPDGKYISYIINTSNTESIVIIDNSSSEKLYINLLVRNYSSIAFSPDSKHLSYIFNDELGKTHIQILKFDD